ncbi:MAG: hypothetical protein QOH70_3354 [Blastocatellia bacterium]|nr:hypothetical protein [Blastocatellia bacterium]
MAGILECGGKRSATPLWIGGGMACSQSLTQQISFLPEVVPQTKAPSPLRSAGALHKKPRSFPRRDNHVPPNIFLQSPEYAVRNNPPEKVKLRARQLLDLRLDFTEH